MTKTATFDPAVVTEIIASYKEATDYDTQQGVIKEWAEKLGRSVPSIRQKLVREGVYQKKEYKTKQGAKPTTKETIVEQIATKIGVPMESLESLTKANKSALVKIRDAL